MASAWIRACLNRYLRKTVLEITSHWGPYLHGYGTHTHTHRERVCFMVHIKRQQSQSINISEHPLRPTSINLNTTKRERVCVCVFMHKLVWFIFTVSMPLVLNVLMKSSHRRYQMRIGIIWRSQVKYGDDGILINYLSFYVSGFLDKMNIILNVINCPHLWVVLFSSHKKCHCCFQWRSF